MSEIKLISPMLDNFAIGDPISEHSGVRCCPAMPNDSNKRYIVKIISVPASQVQVDALLLTGACRSQEDAQSYFEGVAQRIVQEVETLQRLSEQEGFVPFESYQLVPMESQVGFDIYLLSPYKRSLERFFRRETMTHLKAVNLGLDMCASLAIARRAGYLYADLKPSNIFISEDKEFRIGDLGFIPMDELRYSTLPDRYRSCYTAPEMQDPFAQLNTTVDIYAAGLILYQAYNGGQLPFTGDAPAEELPAPEYADYEIAEIILKACAPDPKDRWQDPLDMGHAIVEYMQRNGVNDVPIVSSAISRSEESVEKATEEPEEEPISMDSEEYEQIMLESIDLAIDEAFPEEPTEDNPEEAPAAEDDTDDPANLSFMDLLISDETAPSEDLTDDITYQELSNETSDILSLADDLIAHDTPEGVIQPEPIDVPMPEPIVLEPDPPQEAEEPEEPVDLDGAQEAVDGDIPAALLTAVERSPKYDELDLPAAPQKKKSSKKIIGIILAILLAVGILAGCYYYYTQYYLQTIDSLTLTGNEDYLTVSVETDIDESLLSVICTNTYGEKQTKSLENGTVTFEDLNANTLYTVTLHIGGLHQLKGKISASYTTPAKSNVVTFNAIAGSTEGSVILRFTVDGMDPDIWNVAYSAEGEEEKIASTTGHMTTITGLTVGKTYTFRLISDTSVYIVGNHTLDYTVSPLVYAQNLQILSCSDGILTAQWDAPADQQVAQWTVRCYNDTGTDVKIQTAATTVEFTGLDCSQAYTVEVTADGMTTSERVYVSANSVTVANPKLDTSKANSLTVTWENKGTAPEGNWILLYTIDNGQNQEVSRTAECSATISPVVPGATYQFTLQTESGVTVFNGNFTGQTPEAKKFEGFGVTADNMTAVLCKTANMADLKYKDWSDLTDSEYAVDSFAAGEKASVAIRLSKQYESVVETVVTQFVIRDAAGTVVSCASTTNTWNKMFYKYNCQVDIPALPSVPGSYTVEVYFNGMAVHEQSFTVTA